MKLRPYYAYLELLVKRFDELRYTHLPRAHNRFIDALTTLVSMVDIPINVVICPLLIESRTYMTHYCMIGEIDIQDFGTMISTTSSNLAHTPILLQLKTKEH